MKRPCTAFAAAAILLSSLAAAAGYPVRPIRVIVPVPAGGTPDVMVRLVTPGISSVLGEQLVVDNRAGAGGLIGAEIAAHATPDGYTLFMSSPGPLTIVPHLRKKVPYDPMRDFVPISLVSIGPFLLLAHPSVPVKSVKDLIALARAEPGKLNYASAGTGSANHLAMELFKGMAGIDIMHIPYKGAPQAVTDLLSGRINLMFNSIAPVLHHIRAGRLRALGIGSLKRSPLLPDVPTIDESGVPGFEAISWFGLLAPAKTPAAILKRLNRAVVEVVQTPAIRKRFESLGAEPVGSSPSDFAALIHRESQKYGAVVKRLGITAD